MKTSINGVCSILADEAIVLSAYNDGVGVFTIGAGHTAMAGIPTPVPGMKISLIEAINVFRRDLRQFEGEVANSVTVPVTQNQFDALVSWHFNTGSIHSATLTRKLNLGDYNGASKEFAKWNKAAGRVMPGLVNRRKRETAIFFSADYDNRSVPVFNTKGGKGELYSIGQIAKLMQLKDSFEEELTTEQLLENPNSALLPHFRPKQSEFLSRAIVEKFKDLIPEDRQGDSVKLVSVRGYYTDTMGKKGVNDRNLYDDAIFVLEPEGVHNFNGNSDPSRFKKGIAQLKSPQAVRYIPGDHGFNRKNGPYPAFRQHSECTVIRDQTGEDTGIFWINLHRGGNTTTSSAGCQTVPPNQWNEFKSLVDNLLIKYGQKTFYYLLVDQLDVPAEETLVDVQGTKPFVIMEEEKNMASKDSSEILEILRAALALTERIKRARSADIAPVSSATGSLKAGGQNETNAVLRTLLAALGGADAADKLDGHSESIGSLEKKDENGEEKLTPVNAALGEGIGKALDGKKTAIGIFGLLATAIVPIFFPALTPVIAGTKAIVGTVSGAAGDAVTPTMGQSIMAAAGPIFTAIAGWGALGKTEKWLSRLRK